MIPNPPNKIHLSTKSDSSNYQFVRRIPKDLKESLVGHTLIIALDEDEIANVTISKSTQSVRVALRTSDKRIATRRARNANLRLDTIFEQTRSAKRSDLSHKQVMALAGEFYAAYASEPDRPIDSSLVPSAFQSTLAPRENFTDYFSVAMKLEALSQTLHGQAVVGGDAYLLETYGPVAERLLAIHGLDRPSPNTKLFLVQILDKTMAEALKVRARYATGDYSADANIARYPKWQDVYTRPDVAVSLNELFEGWWREAEATGATQSTYDSYSTTIRRFAEFMGSDDATAITMETVVAFKDFRLRSTNSQNGKPISPATVKKSDLAALNSVFKWAAGNGKLPVNPAHGVTVRLPRKVKVRERDFSRKEAMSILEACLAVTDPKSQTELAKRWVPWICAYTGCRVGEAVQLRREDIRFDKEADSWVMRITPEAGTVKTKEFRDVPLHPHLIEQGFIKDCVGNTKLRGGSKYLFMTIKPSSTLRGVWRSKKNRLSEFVRTIVTDPNIAPNHAWRHTFKSIGFEAGIQEKVLDALCGHAAATVGREYGSVTLRTKVDAIRQFPRW